MFSFGFSTNSSELNVKKTGAINLESSDGINLNSEKITLSGPVKCLKGISAPNISQLDSKIKKTVDNVKTITENLTDFTQQISDLQTTVDNAGITDVSNLITDVDDLKSDVSTIQGDVSDLQTSVTSIGGRVTTLEGTNLSTISTDISTLQGDVSDLQTSVTSIGGRVTTLEGTNLSTISTDISTLQGDVSDLQTSAGQISSDVSSMDSLINTITSDLETVVSDITFIQGDVSDLETTVGQVSSDISSIDGRVTTLEGINLGTIATDITALQGDVSDLQTTVGQVSSDISSIDGRVTTLEGTNLGTIATDITTLQGDVSDLQTSVGQIDTAINNLQITNADFGIDHLELIGQSNCVGYGTGIEDVLDWTSERMMQLGSFTTPNCNNKLILAKEPLQHKSNDPNGNNVLDPGSNQDPYSNINNRIGCGTQFGRNYIRNNPNRLLTLGPNAVGGSGFTVSEPPTSYGNWAGSLLQRTITRANVVMNMNYSDSVDSSYNRMIGFIWIQGEADWSLTQSQYQDYVIDLVADLRSQIIGATNAPFMLSQLTSSSYGSSIDLAIKNMPNLISNCITISSHSTTTNNDVLHFNADSLRTLGDRFFKGYQFLVNAITPSIDSIETSADEISIYILINVPILPSTSSLLHFDIDYKLSTDNIWTSAFSNSTSKIYNIENPSLGVTYDIRAKCGSTPYILSSVFVLISAFNLAFSVRKVVPSYTGACLRIRRSSDDSEQDIGFDGLILDIAALNTFVDGDSGYVTIIYNQNDSGIDMRQSSTSKQPILVDSGTLITVNGEPSIHFTSTSSMLVDSVALGVHPTIFYMAKINSLSGFGLLFYSLEGQNSPSLLIPNAETIIRYLASGVGTIVDSASNYSTSMSNYSTRNSEGNDQLFVDTLNNSDLLTYSAQTTQHTFGTTPVSLTIGQEDSLGYIDMHWSEFLMFQDPVSDAVFTNILTAEKNYFL